MLGHINGSSNPLHHLNLTRRLHDLLAFPQISSYQATYLWHPGSHSPACPAPSRPSSVIICTTLGQIPQDSSFPWHTMIAHCAPTLAVQSSAHLLFFPTGTISLSVSQLPPSPSTPLISLQPPAKWIMRSISPPRPSGLFLSLHAQPASSPLPATSRPKTPCRLTIQYGGQFVSMNLLIKHLHQNHVWLPGSLLIMQPHTQLGYFPSCLWNSHDESIWTCILNTVLGNTNVNHEPYETSRY